MTDERTYARLAGSTINCLDHGFVRLVDHMGTDINVVRAARVSHDAAWRAGADHGSDARLINYLWLHQHSTPFEAVTFTFEVKAPIFVLRQWHRHRTWSYNEVSARYTELPEEFYTPDVEVIGKQSTTNKQGRDTSITTANACNMRNAMVNHMSNAHFLYKHLLECDVPRELARAVLPVATYSHMFATVNLLNLFKFVTLRTDEHAQYEIQVYAKALLELIRPIVPVCVDAWENY